VTAQPLRLSFYGDDFTGSTDSMEVLARSGVPTVLFLEPPRPEELEAFPGVEAVGVAGSTRALRRDALDAVLGPAFAALARLGAPLTHYKVCSTFDSSPSVGSIGRAIELGRDAFPAAWVPLVVGAPRLGRYTAFGHLFARSGLDSPVYRLDRHPTMSRHPTTPMDESDLRLHLARQTQLPIGLLDVTQVVLPAAKLDRELRRVLDGGAVVVLVDVLAEAHLAAAGRLAWSVAKEGAPGFAVGSSGVEYALAAHWAESGLARPPAPLPPPQPVERCVVVSGSASPVTDRQIAHALEHGFAEIALDAAVLVAGGADAEERAVADAVAALDRGASVILHTARGPDDPRVAAATVRLRELGLRSDEALGDLLGRLLAELLEQSPAERVVVAGGDTSGQVVRRLGVRALEAVAASAPGSPLCRTYAPGSAADGLELVLKGGQVGSTTYFVDTRDGPSAFAQREEAAC
jgi:uncharacterized protein YgbK (DUF1537 family)